MTLRHALRVVLTTALLAACSGPWSPTATSTRSAAELDVIIPMAEAAKLSLNHDYTEVGKSALTFVVQSGREAEFEALDGFVDGRLAGFSSQAGALLGVVLAFDTAAHSEAGFDLFVDELRSPESYDLGAAEPAQLGDEGVCGTGPNPHLDGLVESICIWRSGALVLIAGGPLPMTDIRAVAATMDARAGPRS